VSLTDGAEAFDVTVLEAAGARRMVLFAVGGGGNPERHLPLLTSLAEHGCTVVAPHFERLTSLQHALGARLSVELRLAEGAGHFSFMNVPPPQATEPLANREGFLASLASEVCRFVTR